MKTKLNYLIIGLMGISLALGSCGQKSKGNTGTTEPDSSATSQVATSNDTPVKLEANEKLNDAARFVAGLPVRNENSKLYALSQTKEWKNHARNMDQIWNSFQQNAPKVLSFTQNELTDINRQANTLFYPFGGPDFLFSNAFFPDVDTYFLIGLERTGKRN